jgi:hypothetical protein
MRPETVLVRDRSDRSLSASVFVKSRPKRGGQTARFRLQLRNREDVETARKAGVPISLLEPTEIHSLGYPLSFKPRLLVAESIAGTIAESVYRPLRFADAESAIRPKIEDLVIAMLRIDPLGARRIVRMNRSRIDRKLLLKRILQEDAEAAASSVRLDEFVPALRETSPTRVWRMSKEALAAEDRIDYGAAPRRRPTTRPPPPTR